MNGILSVSKMQSRVVSDIITDPPVISVGTIELLKRAEHLRRYGIVI